MWFARGFVRFVTVGFIVGLLVVVAVQSDPIECPIPGNPIIVTEEHCSEVTACEYDGSYCSMKSNQVAGYIVSGPPQTTARGFKVNITKNYLNETLFGADVENLVLEVINHEEYHLQIKIYDPARTRYEIPYKLNTPEESSSNFLYGVTVSEDGEPFGVAVNRLSTQSTVFEMVGPSTFEDQFLQFTIKLPSDYVYGLGENYHTSLRHNFSTRATYPIFARDRNTVDPGERNHYGFHPYYVVVEDDSGNTHSVLFYNSNAMEYSTFFMDDGFPAITFRSIGGIIDLHLFLGPTPEDVNIQYATAVGKPYLPPYWSLGFTLSRWNYGSTDNYRIVRQRMKDENIPMDCQTFDIDYMDGRRDFTFDPVNWEDFPELIEELHEDDVKVTVILDPAIAIDWDTYPPSQRGKDSDAYIRWMSPDLVPADQPESAETYILGNVWPVNRTVFPDFMKPQAVEWWQNEITLFYEDIKFDALWIDMNEPSNIGILDCPSNYLDDPPYPTKAGKTPSVRTICLSTNQTNGVDTFLHYDTHNLYGHSEIIATFNSMETIFPGLRKLILSRSSFPGSGHYAAHWLGDNAASWDQMELSVVGMIEFNMFAIPFVGADICGFIGTSDLELCARWMELGAFYPYSRNHNADVAPDQDPAVWPEVAAISRHVLGLRYKYLPLLYSLFYRASMDGNTVIRPLFNVFPDDITARDVQDQFLWGDTVMVAPVMTQGSTERSIYFPQSLWYRLDFGNLTSSGSETLNVEAPLEYIPVYIRGGKILPFQYPGITTVESRKNSFGFSVALDKDMTAEGELFWDDGVTEASYLDSFYAKMIFQENTLTTSIERNPAVAAEISVSSVDFYGLPWEPSRVAVNGSTSGIDWNYESSSYVLTVRGFLAPISEPLVVELL